MTPPRIYIDAPTDEDMEIIWGKFDTLPSEGTILYLSPEEVEKGLREAYTEGWNLAKDAELDATITHDQGCVEFFANRKGGGT